MRPNNRSPFSKLSYIKGYKAYRPSQDNINPYIAAFASEREGEVNSFQIASNFLKITQISPLKPPLPSMENIAPLRKIHNLKVNTIKQEHTPYRLDLDETNSRDMSDYRTSPFDKLDQTKENKPKDLMITKVAVLRERLERKEQEKEKDREEALKQTRQQQREKTNQDSLKPPRQPPQQVEKEKIESSKVIKQQQQPREQISDADSKKISIYFRHKMIYVSKIVEERLRSMNSGNKVGKVAKLKALNSSMGNSPALAKSPLENLCSEEVAILDEVWKYLKAITSTKSRYKHRDVVNYNKKIRETMKTLIPANSPKLQKDAVSSPNVTLHDEGPKKSKLKKSKSPDPEKLAAINEFLMLKKENPTAKVYICIGAYPALRQALEERGWIENPDTSSKDFDLKWTPKAEINYEALKPHQYFNHYEKHALLTTKLGLARNIKNLIWYENEDIDEYYPRCFDLNDINDFDDFLEDFKFEEVIATLKLAKFKKEDTSVANYNLFKLKLCVALSFCEKRVRPLDMLVYDMVKGDSPTITQEEWELMCAQETENIIDNPKYEKLVKTLKAQYNVEFEGVSSENDEALFNQAEANLARLQKDYPQLSMNQGKNIWIVKPAGLSRGRGICCHNSLPNVLEHIKIKGSEWVAQKYIENPLIIKNRKFDIRQWVVVTDWNPLTVWFYDECYVRFTAQDFNPEDLNNKFAHLTNNAIGRNADNFATSEIEGNMWDCQELRAHLQEATGKDIYEEYIKPQMRNIVIKTLLSGQDMIDSRKNSFDLYGYDFMIDENYKVWVLEINSSPSLEYSTSITERLVSKMMGDIVKVVIDYGTSKGKSKKNVDTGNFQCIYAGKEV